MHQVSTVIITNFTVSQGYRLTADCSEKQNNIENVLKDLEARLLLLKNERTEGVNHVAVAGRRKDGRR
jgi:hypothetical protein